MLAPPHWFFPLDESASLTVRVLGSTCLLGLGILIAARRSRWLARTGLGLSVAAAVCWGGLHLARPSWQRAALADEGAKPTLEADPFVAVGPGVEVATFRLLLEGEELESVALVRLDPAVHRFGVAVDSKGPRPIERWREKLDAIAVVNGSYFLPDRTPQTPLRQEGRALGPSVYTSTHGAFVADPATGAVAIVDLRDVELPRGISVFPEAMVSYPLLLAPDGTSCAEGSHDWLASRTFVGVDRAGWVVLGTTHHGYFTLRRLAAFLRDAPLGLQTALNLDGGPISAQAVRVGDYERIVVGDAETNAGADVLRARIQAIRQTHVALPIVLYAATR